MFSEAVLGQTLPVDDAENGILLSATLQFLSIDRAQVMLKVPGQVSASLRTLEAQIFLRVLRYLRQWRHSRTCRCQSLGRRTWPSCTPPFTKTCLLRRGHAGTITPHKAGLPSSWSTSGGVFPLRPFVQFLTLPGFALISYWKAVTLKCNKLIGYLQKGSGGERERDKYWTSLHKRVTVQD